jgi:transposase-like protein
MKKLTRRRRSQEEIDRIVADYRESGLSQSAFAKDRGLSFWTLSSWLRKEKRGKGVSKRPRRQRASRGNLVPVRIVETPGAVGDSRMEVEVGRGYCLRFSAGLDPKLVARYVYALEEEC